MINRFLSKLFPCKTCNGMGGVMEDSGYGFYSGVECPTCETSGHRLWSARNRIFKAFYYQRFDDPGRKELYILFGKRWVCGASHEGCLNISFKLPRFWVEYTDFSPYNNTYDSYWWTGREREFHWSPPSIGIYLRSTEQREWQWNYRNLQNANVKFMIK